MSSKKQRSKEMTTKTNNETPEALSHIKRAHGIYFHIQRFFSAG